MPGPLSAQLIAAYETHADRMFRHCYLRLLSRDAAKQILEDTFVRAWSYLKSETGPNTNIVVRARDGAKLAAAKAAVEDMLARVKAGLRRSA